MPSSRLNKKPAPEVSQFDELSGPTFNTVDNRKQQESKNKRYGASPAKKINSEVAEKSRNLGTSNFYASKAKVNTGNTANSFSQSSQATKRQAATAQKSRAGGAFGSSVDRSFGYKNVKSRVFSGNPSRIQRSPEKKPIKFSLDLRDSGPKHDVTPNSSMPNSPRRAAERTPVRAK